MSEVSPLTRGVRCASVRAAAYCVISVIVLFFVVSRLFFICQFMSIHSPMIMRKRFFMSFSPPFLMCLVFLLSVPYNNFKLQHNIRKTRNIGSERRKITVYHNQPWAQRGARTSSLHKKGRNKPAFDFFRNAHHSLFNAQFFLLPLASNFLEILYRVLP